MLRPCLRCSPVTVGAAGMWGEGIRCRHHPLSEPYKSGHSRDQSSERFVYFR